jgi:hypothetical protein
MYNGQCFVCNPNGSQNAFSIEKWSGQALNNTSTSDKVLVATTPPQSGGNWMWTTKLSSNRLCGIPTAAGGSETTYYADGYYNPGVGSGLFGVLGLGSVNFGGYAGSAFVYGNNAPGDCDVGAQIKSLVNREELRKECEAKVNELLVKETGKKAVRELIFTKYLYQ